MASKPRQAQTPAMTMEDLRAALKPGQWIVTGPQETEQEVVMRIAHGPERPKTERACLSCARPFMSEGIGHRVCDMCKNTDGWSGSSRKGLHRKDGSE